MPKRTRQRLTKTTIEQASTDSFIWDSEVPGFGVRVTSADCRSYVFQFRTQGERKQNRMVIGRFPAMPVEEARRIARSHRVAADRGENPSQARRDARAAKTLGEMAAYYCDVYAVDRSLKPRTVSDARRLLSLYALPAFGQIKVAAIKRADIRRMMGDAKAASGPNQAERLRCVLSKMFSLARDMELRGDNPCEGLREHTAPIRDVYLSEEQVWALLEACDAYPHEDAGFIVKMLLFTGARLQEVVRADWSQFDLDNGIWTKPSSHTKQRREHRLCLDPHLVELLRLKREQDHRSAFLFPGRTPDRPRTDLNRHWDNLLSMAGLDWFRRHDLRRTTASFMISTGSDLATVGKALGHTQFATTLRYARVFEKPQRDGLTRAVEAMRRPEAA